MKKYSSILFTIDKENYVIGFEVRNPVTATHEQEIKGILPPGTHGGVHPPPPPVWGPPVPPPIAVPPASTMGAHPWGPCLRARASPSYFSVNENNAIYQNKQN